MGRKPRNERVKEVKGQLEKDNTRKIMNDPGKKAN